MSFRNKILVLFAHPAIHKSRINKRILEVVKDIPGVTLNNLYEEYPEFHIDIKREQQLLLEHDVIVWQHPFYWYSAPAIVKEWIDLVLEHGFAYGRKGKALEGKAVFNSISAGGRAEAYMEGGYNEFTINQFLYPFRQTAKLCNMNYLAPFVIHGTHLLKEEGIENQLQDYIKILKVIRDGIFEFKDLQSVNYLNDILELKDKS